MMVFLILLTLICLHAMQNSLLQTNMSQNFYLANRSFNAAETALIKAEQRLYAQDLVSEPLTIDDDIKRWLAKGRVLIIPGMQARFNVVKLQTVCYQQVNKQTVLDYYRVTVWVLNKKLNQPLLLQSTYAKQAVKTPAKGRCLPETAPTLGRQSWYRLT